MTRFNVYCRHMSRYRKNTHILNSHCIIVIVIVKLIYKIILKMNAILIYSFSMLNVFTEFIFKFI